jgi:hypothetical protein
MVSCFPASVLSFGFVASVLVEYSLPAAGTWEGKECREGSRWPKSDSKNTAFWFLEVVVSKREHYFPQRSVMLITLHSVFATRPGVVRAVL